MEREVGILKKRHILIAIILVIFLIVIFNVPEIIKQFDIQKKSEKQVTGELREMPFIPDEKKIIEDLKKSIKPEKIHTNKINGNQQCITAQ